MPEVEVNPTLVVGVGGTGCHVVKMLRKMIEQDVDEKDRERIPMRFIGIDTNLKELNGCQSDETPLHFGMAIAGAAKALGKPEDKSEAGSGFRAWLPKNSAGKIAIDPELLAKGEGAGGMRLLGRYAFKYFAPYDFQTVQEHIESLRDICNNPIAKWRGLEYVAGPRIEIFLVCSLAGGTGSGAFLDALAMCHRLCNEAASGVTRGIHLVLVTPSAFQNVVNQKLLPVHKATAYACLKDLENLLSDAVPKTFEFHGQRDVTIRGPIADNVYLLGRHGTTGTVSDLNELFRILAIQLYAMIGTPMGMAFSSISNNNSTLNSKDSSGQKKRYSAFGLVGLDYDLATRMYRASSSVAKEAAIAIRLGQAGVQIDGDTADREALSLVKAYTNGTAAPRVTELMGNRASALSLPGAAEEERPKEIIERIRTASGRTEQSLQSEFRSFADTAWNGSAQTGTLGWKADFEFSLYDVVRRYGTCGARLILASAEILVRRAKQDLDDRIAPMALSALSADANARLDRISGFAMIMRPVQANTDKLTAIGFYNNGVEAALRDLSAKQIADTAFGPKGLLSVLTAVQSRVNMADDLARRTADALVKRSEVGESPQATALDRSRVIYDVVREWDDVPNPAVDGRGIECFQAWISGVAGSPTDPGRRIVDELCSFVDQSGKGKESGDVKLANVLSECAGGLIQDSTVEHILDVIMPGKDTEEIQKNLRRTVKNLTPLALVDQLDPDDAPLDIIQALVPAGDNGAHPKQGRFDTIFNNVCREVLRGSSGCTTFGGRPNRMLIAKWIHGFALSDLSFGPLAELRKHYQQQRPKNDFLEVDARWMNAAGPGEGTKGGRPLLWALGLAYGLIAQKGNRYFNNLRSMHQRNPEVKGTREEFEVDAALILKATSSNKLVQEWLPTVLVGPCSQTLSKKKIALASDIGEKGTAVDRNVRDLFGTGRDKSMSNFINDVGEDFTDVEIGLTLVLNAYVESRGKANVLVELNEYEARLTAVKGSSEDMAQQVTEEISMIGLAIENLHNLGTLGLPEPSGIF